MTAGWIAYVLAVSALTAAAARAAEAALRTRGGSLRWLWAAGLAATAAVPLAPRLLPLVADTTGGAGRTAVGGAGTIVSGGGASAAPAHGLEPGALGAVADALATPLPDGLAAGLGVTWAAASLALLAMLAGGWLRLRRRCRTWPRGRAAGDAVRVSRSTGPAAAGLLRPVVIVPAWLLRRGESDVRMAVLHEREHARARDPALLAAGRALAALVPWNPFLWWQLRRLRLAVELDCDRRVLERGLPRRDYGRLLLEVSTSPSGGFLRPAATLSERPTHLEERIRAMTSESASRFGVLRTVSLVGLALGLVAVACETPPPSSSVDGGDAGAEATADRGGDGDEAEASAARQLDRKPEPVNRRQIQKLLFSHYPASLREEGVGGEVTLRIRVGSDGRVTRTRVQESSGHPELDAAARQVVASMEFEPATRDGAPVAAWTTQWIYFAVHGTDGSDSAVVKAATGAAGSTLRIRDDAPLGPDDMPLIYIDGTPVAESGWRVGDEPGPAGSRKLDPDDIESIEILKGEPAVAAYGEEAAGGVVLIGTKDGARGSG